MKRILAYLLFSNFIFYSATATAEDYPQDTLHLEYTGSVVIPPCMTSRPKLDIVFTNDLNASDLATQDSASNWIEFELATTCDEDTELTATFTGDPDGTATQYFASTGTAKHLAIELQVDEKTVKPNEAIVREAKGKVQEDIKARVRIHNTDGQAPTPGTVIGLITVVYTVK